MTTAWKNGIRVVVLLDGRPGHEKQTKGIIQALQAKLKVEIREIVVAPPTPLDLIWQLVLLFLPGKGWSHPQIHDADLLFGTGSRTHLPLLLFKKRYAIPAVICMSPPFFLRSRFDLCLVPEHDGIAEQPNIMHTRGAPNCSLNKNQHQEDCGLILLGGVDFKSHLWESTKIARMVRQIVQQETNQHWTIASSPRTPQETVELMQVLATDFANATFFGYKNTLPGWIESQYDKSRMVWVTSDSISMIYEALTAGCKVGIIPMKWTSENSKFKQNEDLLLKNGLVISFSSWEQGNATWSENIELNEARRCAERILQIWSKN
ncbi:MAG: mitochondrial fission ELM1 family protein [Proteobacteria bacterium]|nr:mitochondrial fission ELM1 family protein [Pseudomonadota bacterium]